MTDIYTIVEKMGGAQAHLERGDVHLAEVTAAQRSVAHDVGAAILLAEQLTGIAGAGMDGLDVVRGALTSAHDDYHQAGGVISETAAQSSNPHLQAGADHIAAADSALHFEGALHRVACLEVERRTLQDHLVHVTATLRRMRAFAGALDGLVEEGAHHSSEGAAALSAYVSDISARTDG